MQGDDDGEMTSEMERKFEITAEKAHEILRRMSDEDCEALGFNVKFSRPDWMILTVLPVPPPPVRPSVMMDSAARYDCFPMHLASSQDILVATLRLQTQVDRL